MIKNRAVPIEISEGSEDKELNKADYLDISFYPGVKGGEPESLVIAFNRSDFCIYVDYDELLEVLEFVKANPEDV